MRTADQVKAKIIELSQQKKTFESISSAMNPDDPGASTLSLTINQLNDRIMMLEWVLNEPSGKYHM